MSDADDLAPVRVVPTGREALAFTVPVPRDWTAGGEHIRFALNTAEVVLTSLDDTGSVR